MAEKASSETTPAVCKDSLRTETTEHEWINENIDLLHIIAQEYCHGTAFLVGNRSALVKLRAAIDTALSDGVANVAMFADDGEGYGVYIRVVTTKEMKAVPFGYTDADAQRCRPWPKWMWRAL